MSGWRVEALLGGTASPFRGEETSAIAKTPLPCPVTFAQDGLVGDEQADRRVHGGPEMAVHCYPLDHHEGWRESIGDHELLADPGAFGSNLVIRGIDESLVHIGDRFRLGSVVLELCQPRQPCWKVEHRFGQKGMVAQILRTGRCGWYFRVLEPGTAQAGDRLERIATGEREWPVLRAFAALWGITSKTDPDELRELASLDCIAGGLRDKIAKRLG